MPKYQFILIIIMFVFFGCSNTVHQKIVINNTKKTISLLDFNFVIDSISISKFGKPKLSISLKDKLYGLSSLNITHPNLAYKIDIDESKSLNCDDENLTLLIIIRKKGQLEKVTENIANNFKNSPNIQVLYRKYFPCSKEIDTLETDGYLK